MTAQVRRGRTTDPEWKRNLRALPIPLAILLVLALLIAGTVYACSGPEDDVPSGGAGDGKVTGPSFSVSYAGGADRLRGLTGTERTEQIRDWARFGLAARLGVSSAGYRDSSYDTLPVRDRAFDGLARQAYGPGRFLHDGDGRRDTLHVLVPGDDEHRRRTVGQQIDQYRTDAGADPERVQVHEYEIRPGSRKVRISVGKAARTAKVRAAYGYVTKRVDTADGLRDFLRRTDRLSSLRTRGAKIYAHGWSSGGKPLVHAEDVSVLQRGYTSAGRTPGFSLDPAEAKKPADVRAALPGLKEEWADALAAGHAPDGLEEKVDGALFEGRKHAGLPGSRAQLWALKQLLDGGRGAFTQARYDGGLAGTEAGMTMFYTDYVAKHWVAGVGTGVPSKAVGFVPDPKAEIPWGQCTGGTEGESGRLWFGQNQSGFSYDADRVDIGEQATRVFARSDGEAGEAGEVEPSYAFGRGLRWWDQNYQAVADYEQQYERLDELMRWGGALDWLSRKGGGAELPEADDGDVRTDLRFQDWYAEHDELRERGHIEFVDPPSATREALQNGASRAYEQCGGLRIKGGVSLADRLSYGGDIARPDLPPRMWRAGEFAPGAEFDAAAGTGRVEQVWKDHTGHVTDSVEHTFERGEYGGAVVTAKGRERTQVTLGELRQTQAGGTGRETRTEISGGPGVLRQDVGANGERLGELRGARTADGVSLSWDRGPVDRFRAAARSVQERLGKGPGKRAAVPAADDVLYGYEADGETYYKVGNENEPWFTHTDGDKAKHAVLALRLGAPGEPGGGGVEQSTAALVPGPGGKGPGAPRGPPSDGYVEVEPPPGSGDGGGGGPAMISSAGKPGEDEPRITVESYGGGSGKDGKSGEVSDVDGRARAATDDPVVGLGGSAEGAALMRDFAEVRSAMNDAARADDGTYRAVALGPGGADGAALVRPGKVVLVETGTVWAAKIRHALAADASAQGPAFRYAEGGEPLHVSKNTLRRGEGDSRTTTLGDVFGENPGGVYASPRLAAHLHGGKHEAPRYAPGYKDLKVVVVPVEVVETSRSGESHASGADGYRYEDAYWSRIAGPGEGGPGGPDGGGGGGGRGGGGDGGEGWGRLPVRVHVTTPSLACTEAEVEDPDSPCYEQN